MFQAKHVDGGLSINGNVFKIGDHVRLITHDFEISKGKIIGFGAHHTLAIKHYTNKDSNTMWPAGELNETIEQVGLNKCIRITKLS